MNGLVAAAMTNDGLKGPDSAEGSLDFFFPLLFLPGGPKPSAPLWASAVEPFTVVRWERNTSMSDSAERMV
jgi:hypothetical protein